jgi:hypothetical protein
MNLSVSLESLWAELTGAGLTRKGLWGETIRKDSNEAAGGVVFNRGQRIEKLILGEARH